MTAPQISVGLVDPGAVSVAANNDQAPIYGGVCSQGDSYVVQTFTRAGDIRDEFGHGHLVDVGVAALAKARQVKLARLPDTVAGVIDIDDSSPEELIVDSVTGDPLNFLAIQIETLSGDGATAISTGTIEVRYSLDDWGIPNVDKTWSAPVTVPASGQLSLANVGLVANLDTAQTPELGATADLTVEPRHYSSTEVAAWQSELESPVAGEYTYLVFTGEPQTASAANTIAGAIDALAAALFAKGRIIGALLGSGLEDDTDVITAFAARVFDPPFGSAGYGAGYRTNPTSQQGRGRLGLRQHEVAAIRIAGLLVSTDPGRTASGSLSGVVGTDYNAALEGDALHDARISVLRTWEPHERGLFIQRQLLLSPVDTNFKAWPHAAVMIVALRAAHRVAFRLVLEIFRRTSTGTLDPKDAADIDAAVEAELDRVVGSSVRDVRGQEGHVSTFSATTDLTVLLPSIRVDIRLRPKGYGEDLVFSLQYADEV